MSTGPIQTSPAGLLGLLNLKNLGKNPAQLEDAIQPVLEFLDMYLATGYERVQSTAQAVAQGTNVTDLVVPQNEVWFVRHVSIDYGVLGAGAALIWTPAYRPGAQLHVFPLGAFQRNAYAATESARNAVTFERPLVAMPSTAFGAYCHAVTLPQNFTCSVLITRARI